MSRFRNPMLGLLPGAPIGARPMAPPLQNPNVPQPGGGQLFTSSSQLVDGTPKLLAKFQYPEPRPCGIYACAPLTAFNQQNTYIGQKGSPDNELWILGHLVVGIGGTSFQYDFDIPAGQVVQIQHVAQYLELSARLINLPKPDGAGNDFNGTFLNPPQFTGVPQSPVMVVGQGGEGYVGLSNATRRARLDGITALSPLTCPAPSMATSVQITAKSSATANWIIEKTNVIFTAMTLGPITLDCGCELPVPEGSGGVSGGPVLKLVPAGADNIAAEIVWRLGFSGVQA